MRAADKPQLLAELRRVLRPGGHVGFSDQVFSRPPTAAEDRALRALPFHSGRDLLTDWPGLFAAAGFQLLAERDSMNRELCRIIDEPTKGPWGIRAERVEIKDVGHPGICHELFGRP